MNILLFGKHGQLGWELDRSLQCLGRVSALDYPEVDFMRPASLKQVLYENQPHIVINAAAYTDVDKAEAEANRAGLINTEAPAILAETCRELGAIFFHFSTDYVFDGTKGTPYREEDAPRPRNVYGRTKLEGEQATLGAGGTNFVFRTAWVYSLRRDSFVTKVLRWAHSQPELRIVEDQISNPTWARELAESLAQLIAKAGPDPIGWLSQRSGLYHLAGGGYASRLEWAREILRDDPDADRQTTRVVRAARSGEFATAAERPMFSALDCRKFQETFDLRLPNWDVALRLALACEYNGAPQLQHL